MSKYRGPRLRLVRKLGNLPGLTKKRCKNQLKTPGQHGKPQSRFRKKMSAYGLRLLEKQKLRFNYGINERQLVRYVKQAKRTSGPTGENLLRLLEMRLDNVVYRLGMAPTIAAARQLVGHGHIQVNQKKLTIPSYSCQLKDVITVRETKASQQLVKGFLDNQNMSQNKKQMSRLPYHLSFNRENLAGVVNNMVNRRMVGIRVNELLVVEYYSRN